MVVSILQAIMCMQHAITQAHTHTNEEKLLKWLLRSTGKPADIRQGCVVYRMKWLCSLFLCETFTWICTSYRYGFLKFTNLKGNFETLMQFIVISSSCFHHIELCYFLTWEILFLEDILQFVTPQLNHIRQGIE